jgi:hypothetical protein
VQFVVVGARDGVRTVMIEEQIRPFAPAVELLCTIPAFSAAAPSASLGRSGPT